jgi:hypothetical protein
MPAFDGLSPYLKVAAGQMLEDPEVMKLTRDLVAMRREGRQNMFASIVSGGKFGSVGRVTAANMTGPDLSRISDLEAERARILSEAMKARLVGVKGLKELADGGNDVAKAFLSAEGTVLASNSAATAVKYKEESDRLTVMEERLAQGQEGLTNKGLYGQIRSAAEGTVGGVLQPVQQGYIAFQKIPAGAFSAVEHGSVITEYLGPRSPLNAEQKAILRVQLLNRGVTQDDLAKIAPISTDEQAVFSASATSMNAYMGTIEKRAQLVEDLGSRLDKAGVGVSTFGTTLARRGSDLTKTQQLGAHLAALNGLGPVATKTLEEIATNPLLPDAKKRMDAIDDEIGQLKSAQGGLLKNDALLSLRSSRALPELVKNAVYVAYDKKIALADAEPEAKAKLEAERDERLSTVDAIGATAEGGRRAARALIREQKGLQRGVRLAAEVSDTGDVARTRERNIVASEADRAATLRATADAGQMDRLGPDEARAAIMKTATDKSLTQGLGVGQGSRPLYGRPVAGAPPKADTEPDEEEDDGTPKAPEAEETAAWTVPPRTTQAFDRAVLKGDLVRERLAQFRGLSRA